MARSHLRSRLRRRRGKRSGSYGLVLRSNPLPLLPILGVMSAGLILYKVYDIYKMMTRPAVLVGTGIGAVIGYKQAKGFFEHLAYVSVGTGLGLIVDRYVFEGGE